MACIMLDVRRIIGILDMIMSIVFFIVFFIDIVLRVQILTIL